MKTRVLFAVLVCGCGTESPAGQISQSVIHNACGNAGGAAYILVTSASQQCTSGVTGDRDEIRVMENLPSAAGTVEGSGQVCSGSTCTRASAASITFTSITATEARGTYFIKTANGHRTESFVAPRCNEKMLCF